MVASDGGVFAFGDAAFEGSLGASPPSSPIVYMAPTPDDNGYWLLSQDGTVYAFGDAGNYGSVQGRRLPPPRWRRPRRGATGSSTADGAVYPFGNAKNYGSPGPVPVPAANVQATSPTSGSTSGSGNAGSSASRGTSPAVDQGAQPFGWDGRRR